MEQYGFEDLREALVGQSVDLVLTGPPGCGKGTQGELLESAGIGTLATMSTVMRNAAAQQVIDGHALQSAMKAGQFAPHDMVAKAVEHCFPTGHPGMLLIDGMPRTMEQITILNAIQLVRKRALIIVAFGADSETLLTRQTSRTGRPDATLEAAQRRLKDYSDETQPVVDYLLRQHGGVEVHTGPTHVAKFEVSARLDQALAAYVRQRTTTLVPETLPDVPNFAAAQ